MKWIANTLIGILIALGVGLTIVAFEDQIKRVVATEKVVAEVYVGPWYPAGGMTDDMRVPATSFTVADTIKHGHQERGDVLAGDHLNFAKVVIRNNTPNTINSVRVDLRAAIINTVDFVVAAQADAERDRLIPNAKFADLPPIAPGDHRTVYLWASSDLRNEFTFPVMKVFTSGGMADVRIKRYVDEDTAETGLEALISDSIPWLTGVPLFALGLMAWTGFILASKYNERLLKDQDFYLEESARYEANPKSFEPRLKKPKAAS